MWQYIEMTKSSLLFKSVNLILILTSQCLRDMHRKIFAIITILMITKSALQCEEDLAREVPV